MAASIAWRLSGGAGNADPAASLGGVISSTAAGATIFDDVSGTEASTGDTEYRGVYVYNAGDASLLSAVVWIQTNTPDTETTIAIALADEGSNATMETIANENTAPVGPTFSSSPVDLATGLSIGTLAAGQRYGIWVRRTVNAAAGAYNDDTFTLRAQGDTGA